VISDSEWRLLQADKFAAERQRDEAIRSANSWRQEAKWFEAQCGELKAQVDRLLAKEKARIVQELMRPPGS
jgi:hypothetical protein